MRPGQRRLSIGSVVLDDIDFRILHILQYEGRISKSELASRVNLSNSACFERLNRLEKSGVIKSYHARMDVLKLGNPLLVQIHIVLSTQRPQNSLQFEEWARRDDRVVECASLSGDISYSLLVCVMRIDDYQEFIDDMMGSGAGIDRYYSYFVTKHVKSGEISIAALAESGLR